MSHLEATFKLHCRAEKLTPKEQYRLFAEHLTPGKGLRKRLKDAGLNDYCFDFAFPMAKLVIEIQGGQWRRKGAHNTGVAINRDCKKHNDAVELGWTVLLFSGDMVKSGEAIKTTVRVLEMLTGRTS